MAYLWIYLASLATFLLIDAVWLTLVMRPMFDRYVGALLREEILISAAAAFYLAYIAGVIYFCVLPALESGTLRVALVNGLILGFLAYGTYEFTNMTTLKGWTWPMVLVDTGWGMALTAAVAVAGTLVGRAVLPSG